MFLFVFPFSQSKKGEQVSLRTVVYKGGSGGGEQIKMGREEREMCSRRSKDKESREIVAKKSKIALLSGFPRYTDEKPTPHLDQATCFHQLEPLSHGKLLRQCHQPATGHAIDDLSIKCGEDGGAREQLPHLT